MEKELLELKNKIDQLKTLYKIGKKEVEPELRSFQRELRERSKKLSKNLNAWDRVLIARNQDRPITEDYIKHIFKDFIEIHGDRCFGDDKAIITGFGKLYNKKVLIIGNQKGKNTKENIQRNFGMAHPEGYRKAIRAMKLAEKFSLPVISFVDTAGAYPGIGAEERGQAEAIAKSIQTMISLKVPIIVIIIGEGGSGGALGIGVGDKVLMLENAWFSVISPEGCAAILWKDQEKVKDASQSLKLDAISLKEFGIIDEIIKEPYGLAHLDQLKTIYRVKFYLKKCLKEIENIPIEKLLEKRFEKYLNIGVYEEI